MQLTDRLSAIRNHDFGLLTESFRADHPEYADRFDECALELGRFLQLPLLCDGPLAAMSHGVDGLWHTFILYTPQYRDFCQKIYGGYLQHQPRSSRTPVPTAAISNFYKEYPRFFGEVPAIWLEDIPLEFREAVRAGEAPDELQQLRWSGWPGWGMQVYP